MATPADRAQAERRTQGLPAKVASPTTYQAIATLTRPSTAEVAHQLKAAS